MSGTLQGGSAAAAATEEEEEEVEAELVLEGAAATMRAEAAEREAREAQEEEEEEEEERGAEQRGAGAGAEPAGSAGCIRVALHIWASPATLPIVDELFLGIHASGLYEACAAVHCFVAGPDAAAMAPVLDYLRRRAGAKVRVEREAPGDRTHERLALENLRALVGPEDALLYMHTKGASAKYLPGGAEHGTKGPHVAAWRRALLLECVTSWRMCAEALRRGACDVIGPAFRTAPRPHFSGNFWWARGRHLLEAAPRRVGPGYFDPELAFICEGAPRVAELDRLPLAGYGTTQPPLG
jgi:hypothetical protein